MKKTNCIIFVISLSIYFAGVCVLFANPGLSKLFIYSAITSALLMIVDALLIYKEFKRK